MTEERAVFDVLKRILVDDLQIRANDITPAAKCTEVGVDSLAVIELASVLNSRFGIEIYDYELLELRTVGDIADLVEERCSSRYRGTRTRRATP